MIVGSGCLESKLIWGEDKSVGTPHAKSSFAASGARANGDSSMLDKSGNPAGTFFPRKPELTNWAFSRTNDLKSWGSNF